MVLNAYLSMKVEIMVLLNYSVKHFLQLPLEVELLIRLHYCISLPFQFFFVCLVSFVQSNLLDV